jgi:hypothetical protein
LFILACTLALPASAQLTWKNLHFGQSRDEARAQLTTQNIAVQNTPDGSLQSTADYELPIPPLQHTFPMVASFHFDDAGQLAEVTLALDVPAMRRYWGTLGTDDALFTFAEEKLITALTGRYGTALYRTPTCDSDPKQSCTSLWRGPDQSIVLDRLTTPRGPRLIIRYQPLATDI